MKRAITENIEEKGSLKLIRKITRRRKILSDRFYSKYPETFVKIASVPVTKAEEILGKGSLDGLVEYDESERTYIEDKTEK
jgi:hypothetical protein